MFAADQTAVAVKLLLNVKNQSCTCDTSCNKLHVSATLSHNQAFIKNDKE